MKINLVSCTLIFGLLLVVCSCALGAEDRFYISAYGCQVGDRVPALLNVDVYLDGTFVGNSNADNGFVTVTTTIGYHDVKLIKNGCEKSYGVLFNEKLLYNNVRLDFCECDN